MLITYPVADDEFAFFVTSRQGVIWWIAVYCPVRTLERQRKILVPYVHDFMPITNTSFLQLHNLLFAVLTVHKDKNIFYMWQVVLTVILGNINM